MTKLLSAQTLKGNVRVDRSKWQPTVYLLKIERFQSMFNGDIRLLVDSTKVDPRGDFSFSGLKPRSLYRLGMINTGEDNGGSLVSDGTHDNHIFVLTDDAPSMQQLTFNADSMLLSARFRKASVRTVAFNKLFKERLPLFRVLQSFDSVLMAAGGDSAAKSRIVPFAMKAIQQTIVRTDTPLAAALLKTKDPLVFAAGMEVYCGFETIEKNPVLVAHGRKVLAGTWDPYSLSLLEQCRAVTADAEKQRMVTQPYSTLDGRQVRLDTIGSRFILLDFWASWCSPCRGDFKRTISKLDQKNTAQTLCVVGVNMDTDKQKALNAVEADHNTYLQIFSGRAFESPVAKTFSIHSLPGYVLYDQQKHQFYPGLTANTIQLKIDELLQQR